MAEDISKLSEKIAVVDALLKRLEITLNKTTDLSFNLKTIIERNGEILKSQDEKIDELYNLIDDQTKKNDQNFKELFERGNAVNKKDYDILVNRITALEHWKSKAIGIFSVISVIVTTIMSGIVFYFAK